jgi:hypothetical protein
MTASIWFRRSGCQIVGQDGILALRLLTGAGRVANPPEVDNLPYTNAIAKEASL